MAQGNPVAAATSPEPSALGDEAINWVAVSPGYSADGLVVAVGNPYPSCGRQSGCADLWVTHDGGSSWTRAKGTGWGGAHVFPTVDGDGNDVLFSPDKSGLLRSDDDGDSWHRVAPIGNPALSPRYSSDGTVAVASSQGDYVLTRGNAVRSVPGSSGGLVDLAFDLPPSYPSGGRFAPVLLSAGDHKQGLPVIQQCDATFACKGAGTLPGATSNSAPTTLVAAGDYPESGVVFAQSQTGIYKSTDGGATFAPLPIGATGASVTATPMMALGPGYHENGGSRTAYVSVFQVFLDPKDPKASHSAGGVYRSDDGGGTWRSMGGPSPFDGGSTAVAVAPDGRVFAAYLSSTPSAAGLLCSVNGGATWQASCPHVGTWSARRGALPGSEAARGCASAGCTSSSPQTAPGAAPAHGKDGGGGAALRLADPAKVVGVRAAPSGAALAPLAVAAGLVVTIGGVSAAALGRVRRRRKPRD
jgi:hypothetical protein